jgi:hypothetical protein
MRQKKDWAKQQHRVRTISELKSAADKMISQSIHAHPLNQSAPSLGYPRKRSKDRFVDGNTSKADIAQPSAYYTANKQIQAKSSSIIRSTTAPQEERVMKVKEKSRSHARRNYPHEPKLCRTNAVPVIDLWDRKKRKGTTREEICLILAGDAKKV